MKKDLSFILVLLMVCVFLPQGAVADVNVLTRGEWIHRLVETFNMIVEDDDCPDNYYSDINSDYIYYRDILVATQFGVVDTPAGGAFDPNGVPTREYAAHTLNFCLGFQLYGEELYSFTEYEEVNYPDDI